MIAVAVPLTRGHVALVDAPDAERVLARSWHATDHEPLVYAAARIDGRIVYLHRFLLEPPDDVLVDHIDGDGLNDRRANLRGATPTVNAANWHRVRGESVYRGVFSNQYGWCAQIVVGGAAVHLGSFDDERLAALAYDLAAVQHRGPDARVNIGVTPETAALVEAGRRHREYPTHCPAGHEAATYRTAGGHCRECDRLATRAKRAAETPEQRENRLAAGRAYKRAARAAGAAW